MSCVHPGVITLPYANRRMSSLPQAVNRFSPSFPPWQKCRLQPRIYTGSAMIERIRRDAGDENSKDSRRHGEDSGMSVQKVFWR